MLSSLSFYVAINCVLLILTQVSLAANPESKSSNFHNFEGQSQYSPHTTVSEELFQTFLSYTKFAAASYADNCPIPPNGATIANFFNIASTDTQAYLFKDDATKEFILAFRGTSDLYDFAVDLNQTLIPYESVGISGCDSCQVRPFV